MHFSAKHLVCILHNADANTSYEKGVIGQQFRQQHDTNHIFKNENDFSFFRVFYTEYEWKKMKFELNFSEAIKSRFLKIGSRMTLKCDIGR